MNLKSSMRHIIRLSMILPVLLLMFLVFPSVKADAVSIPDLIKNGSGYTSVFYDNTNGLPTSESNTVAQTSDGFIWIGCYSGLIRYNGNEFYRYDSSVGVSSVVSLYVDSSDRLWIGTNDNGAAVMTQEGFQFFDRSEGLNSGSVRSISEDDKGNIIIATTMGLAYVNDEMKLFQINEPQINKEYILELKKGSDDIIYGITLSGGIFTIENLRVSAYYSAKDIGIPPVSSILPDPKNNGYVYIGTEDSSIIYGSLKDGMKNKKTFSVAPHTKVNMMRFLNDQLWCCDDMGIGYFENDKFTEIEDIPMTNSIVEMMTDFEGNMWFCSSRQGLMKIVRNRFIDISKLAKLDNMIVNSTCRHDGELYIASDTGLYILDANYKEKHNDLTKLLDGIRIRCIKEDRNKNLWFCTYSDNGLVCYNSEKDKYTVFNTENGLASNRVRMVKELSDGRMAVATNSGMNIIKNGKVTDTYDSSAGISNLEILSIEENEDGRIYLGSDGDGIYVINGKQISHIGLEDGLSSEVILRIKKDPVENIYWIITSNSISYLKDDKCTPITNFPYSNNFDLYFDENDRVWVLSSSGIYVLKKSDLINNENMYYTLFDTKCGLPAVATANSYSHLDSDGTLYISAGTGVSSVNINQDISNISNIKLAVSYIGIDDKLISLKDSTRVELPADTKRINIYANAFTYSLNNPYLSYYLEGFDSKPTECYKQDLDHVSYTNLKGGEYQFHLSVINTTTGEAERTITVTLVKQMAFYETIWFRILTVLLAIALTAGIVYFIFRRKTKILLAKQQEDKKLINEMTMAFAKCVDVKDAYTNGHSYRVAQYSALFAERLGKPKEEVEKIYNIALMHDIGKISIPNEILNKPGRLTDEEYAVMKTHPSNGYEILKNITIEPDLALGAEYHHERIDGKGYPSGLKGEQIPEIARIIAVADTFDAMHSTRPYRKKMPMDKIVAEIKRCSGTQLDPKVVEVFLQLAEEGAFDEPSENPPPEESNNKE